MRDDVDGKDAATLLGMPWRMFVYLIGEGRILHHDYRVDVSDINSYIAKRDEMKCEHAEMARGYEQRRNERLEKLANVRGN